MNNKKPEVPILPGRRRRKSHTRVPQFELETAAKPAAKKVERFLTKPFKTLGIKEVEGGLWVVVEVNILADGVSEEVVISKPESRYDALDRFRIESVRRLLR